MDLNALQSDPAMMVAAAVIGLGLLGLLAEALISTMRRAASARSPIKITGDAPVGGFARSAMPEAARSEEKASVAAAPEPAAPPEPPKDPIVEHRRFFAKLGATLSLDESAPVALAALHANLTSEVFMDRMALAARGWRSDAFVTAARELTFRAEGTPPDTVATKVLDGYELLKGGQVKEALEAFLAAIEAAKLAASTDASNPWPHAWSAFAWRGLALIAEEAGDVQATLAGLKVAYQSMVNAFEITVAA